MAGTAVTWNSTNLQTDNISVASISHDSIPAKRQRVFALARANKSVITNFQYPEKLVTLEGQIRGTSLVDLETRIEAFKLAVNPLTNTANLDIGYNAGTRRYAASVNNLMISRTDALFAVAYSLELICVDPWGKDTTTTTHINATVETTSPNSEALTIGGTAPEQFLYISYTLNSFTGSAFNTLYIKNNETGQEISIARTWVATDVLIIDIANRSVKVNGVEVDYNGVFPAFAPGSRTLVITDSFTARNYTLTVTQVKRYM